MAFPQTPLPVTVELQLGGTWTDITSKVYVRDPITIKRGRSDPSRDVDPSTCQLTVDNRDGRFSPRNPAGAYYGLIGRNTPLRVKVSGLDDNSLQTTPALTSTATTPHTAALNTTSDLDLRVELTPFDLYTTSVDLIGKWNSAGNQASYLMWTNTAGTLFLSWTTAGTPGTQTNVGSTAPIPRDNSRRFALRASMVVSTGTVTFYYADSIAGPWQQLGDPVVNGATSIWQGTAALALGKATSSGTSAAFTGRFYKAQVRTGLGAGTLVANPDFTAQATGATSFTDSPGRVWTVNGAASISSDSVRFIGEVSQWPVKWDQGEDDVYVPIVASGILRRLLANQPPLRSALRRSIPALASLRAYWPMEDGAGATSLAYGLPDPLGQYAATITNGPSLSSFGGFLASDELPAFSNGSYMRGRVPAYNATNAVQLRFLLYIPGTGQPVNGAGIAKLTTTNSTWSLSYATGGGLNISATNNIDGSSLYGNAPLTMGLDGKLWRISLELSQSGANILWQLQQLQVGGPTAQFFNATTGAATVGAATAVQLGCYGSTNSPVSIGHVTVESTITTLFDLTTQMNAYQSETATARAIRLTSEEGVPFYRFGPSATQMGAQTSKPLVELLRECQDANMGILYEPRGVFALALRPRATMYARDAAVALDYAQGHLTNFEPVEDDQNVINDVVLSRTLGTSYEATLDSGTLSTQAPPNGIGKYQSAVGVNLYADNQLRDQATYRLGLGTLDEPRYPVIGVGLHRFASLALTRAALDADLGDVLQVSNPYRGYAPFDTYQRIEGVTEVLDSHTYDLTYTTSPGSVWRGIGVYDDPTGRSRYDTDTSSLNAGATSTATTLSVVTTDGATWTTDPADRPFQIVVGGEVMTVTNVTGSSSPQTFTVTRSVNGVVKAQTAGTPVHVYTPSYYGF